MKRVLKNGMFLALLGIGVMMASNSYVSATSGNVKDTVYRYNSKEDGRYSDTGARKKTNSTKVYCICADGYKSYLSVRGTGVNRNTDKRMTETRCSKWVSIPKLVQCSVTNTVYEKEYSKARLRVSVNLDESGNVSTYGEWSPDSTKNYHIVG
ncbi:MAG: hypothetical protein SO170_06425 [Butyribacter sp.]|nr:hypothetical protein [bacterium]MDY3854569.1 hypothetical protein [Butyribacter sp.]